MVVDDYDFMDLNGKKRPLCIRTVDLMKMMNWKDFINEVKGVLV